MNRPATMRHARNLMLGSVALAVASGIAGLPWWCAPVFAVLFQATTRVPPDVIKEIEEARKK